MAYMNAGINETPVIVGVANAQLQNCAFKAMAYNASGKLVVANAGGAIAGFALPTTGDVVAEGGDVSIQIKDIGLAKAGAAINTGATLAVGSDGKVVAAVEGDYIVGVALQTASAADTIIQMRIVNGGNVFTANQYVKHADEVVNFKANAQLSSAAKKIAAASGGKAVVNTTSGGEVLGIIDAGAAATIAADADVPIRMTGKATVISGAAVTAGALVMSDANGKAIAATTGKYAIGIALTAASAADKDIDVLITHSYKA